MLWRRREAAKLHGGAPRRQSAFRNKHSLLAEALAHPLVSLPLLLRVHRALFRRRAMTSCSASNHVTGSCRERRSLQTPSPETVTTPGLQVIDAPPRGLQVARGQNLVRQNRSADYASRRRTRSCCFESAHINLGLPRILRSQWPSCKSQYTGLLQCLFR